MANALKIFCLLACSLYAAGFIPIEGTFIQAWLYARWTEDNYIGPKDAWDKEVSYWKSLGITQVIDGDIAYKNSGESTWHACYESKLDSVTVDCRDKDIIMEMAHKYGFKVYLGMGVDNDWWSWDLTRDEDFKKFKNVMMKAGAFAHEIYTIYNTKYPENFGGFYSVYEVWNHNKFNYGDSTRNLYAARLAEGFNIVIDSLNKIDATKPLLFSQFATASPDARDIKDGEPRGFGTLENTEKFWTRFFELAHFRSQDKTLPMDNVGGGGQKIDSVEPWTAAYANAIKNSKSKINYYANIEDFEQPDGHFLYDTERTPLYGKSYNGAAPIGRYARQIAVAERHTKGIFTFAFSHYHSPVNNIPGYYDVLLNYLKTQKGDEVPPTLPNKVTIIDTIAKNIALSNRRGQDVFDKVFKFYWEGASDDHGIYQVKIKKNTTVNGVAIDSTFAYSVSTRTESGVTAHEPDSIYFAYSTGRECIGYENPEEEDCFNPRFKGDDYYTFVVADVWGNETVSKPFLLKSTGGRTTFTPELDSSRIYIIPEKDSLRSYFAIDSAWVRDTIKPTPNSLFPNNNVSRNGLRLDRNGNFWEIRFTQPKNSEKHKTECNKTLEIYSPNGAKIYSKKIAIHSGENIIRLPANSLGYNRFFIDLR